MSWHKILGVSPNASLDDIKKAYRSKAMEFHPDKSKDTDAAMKFIEINKAYRALTDSSFYLKNKPQAKPKPSPQHNSPIRDVCQPFKDCMEGKYGADDPIPYLSRKKVVQKPVPEVNLWEQVGVTKKWEAYWKEYEKLKKITAYEDPEVFWNLFDEWCKKNNM